jgi:hypothetical protein
MEIVICETGCLALTKDGTCEEWNRHGSLSLNIELVMSGTKYGTCDVWNRHGALFLNMELVMCGTGMARSF